MRKYVAVLCVFLILASVLCTTVPAAGIEASYTPFIEKIITAGQYEGNLSDIRYYSFVYTEDDGFTWYRENVIGPNNCSEGYLYTKDLYTEEIHQIIEQPVKEMWKTGETIYCITKDNEILQTDSFGETSQTLCESNCSLKNLIVFSNDVYFIEEEHVVTIDVATQMVFDVGVFDGISEFYIEDKTTLCWKDGEGNTYCRDLETDTDNLMSATTEACMDEHDCADISLCTNDATDVAAIVPAMISSSPVSLPLTEYPVGSYFTNDGQACSHHKTGTCTYDNGCNCRAYAASIQCMGFARYASDQYAHRSSWSMPAGDTTSSITFGSAEGMRLFF